MTYTIFAEHPTEEVYTSQYKINSAGQIILHDGPMTRNCALEVAMYAAHYFGKVQVFAGKNLGKLVWSST